MRAGTDPTSILGCVRVRNATRAHSLITVVSSGRAPGSNLCNCPFKGRQPGPEPRPSAPSESARAGRPAQTAVARRLHGGLRDSNWAPRAAHTAWGPRRNRPPPRRRRRLSRSRGAMRRRRKGAGGVAGQPRLCRKPWPVGIISAAGGQGRANSALAVKSRTHWTVVTVAEASSRRGWLCHRRTRTALSWVAGRWTTRAVA